MVLKEIKREVKANERQRTWLGYKVVMLKMMMRGEKTSIVSRLKWEHAAS